MTYYIPSTAKGLKTNIALNRFAVLDSRQVVTCSTSRQRALATLESGTVTTVGGCKLEAASAELGEHAKGKAGIDQREPERFFPIDAGAPRVGPLPVAEMLEE